MNWWRIFLQYEKAKNTYISVSSTEPYNYIKENRTLQQTDILSKATHGIVLKYTEP